MLKCPLCTYVFDADTQSVLCPHFLLNDPKPPTGGFRFPPDVREALDLALAQRDREAIAALMGHPNPLVRACASRIYLAFREELARGPIDAPGDPSGDGLF